MSVVAIICEYNPFHHGHAYQIQTARWQFGEQTQIISLMSGSVVQRGEVAVSDKYSRATAAVTMGADLVLELPYPYCGSVAERFALGAVSILKDLGCVDYLVFGSETGDVGVLAEHVNRRFAPGFIEYLELKRKEYKTLSFPQLVSACYLEFYGMAFPDTPNDILGMYYLHAIQKLGSDISPMTHARLQGSSATIARQNMKYGSLAYIPKEVREYFAVSPACFENAERAILYSLRNCGDIEMASASANVLSLAELYQNLGDKNTTNANLKRKVIASLLGYSENEFVRPAFTNVLAMNDRGASILHTCKKTSRIPIVTKPADYRRYEKIEDAYQLNLAADGLFAICTPQILPKAWSLLATPFVKK